MSIQAELDRQMKIIRSGTEEIVPEAELIKKLERSLREGRPLKVKLGIDPTGTELHVGHAVPLRKLNQFQKLGHSVELIIGNFTAKIGDPTDRSETRKMLSDSDIETNFNSYIEQAGRILDVDNINIHYNADWLAPLTFEDLVNIMAKFTVSVMISREDFANRLKNNTPISLVELSYPLMQSYDSVYLKADVELGGSDQKFNILRGRDLQRAFGQEPQIGIIFPIIEGTCGKRKMSKSYNNYIAVNEKPNDMFGKVMSITDGLIELYYRLVTELDPDLVDEISKKLKDGSLSPYEAKKNLAAEIVSLYYNDQTAQEAKEYFNTLFSKRAIPENIDKVVFKGSLVALVVEQNSVSKSEARRLITAGAVKLNDEPIKDIDAAAPEGVVKIGKKKIIEVSRG